MTERTLQRRAVEAGWEIRQDGDGTVGLRGYAAMFDTPSHGEVIRSSAFTKTLAERADVRLLVNHDGVPIARTKSGTLHLSVDERGLYMEAPNLDLSNPTVAELVSAMGRGDIDQCSFAFIPVRENYDSETKMREVLECKLMDVSVVTYPWYESTSVELNSLEHALAEVRSGAVTPETRDTIMRALSLSLQLDITDDDDDHDEPDGDEVEGVPDTEEDSLPVSTPETPEATEPRAARRIDIARALYLR
jgi:HK97 family phage prohead protease